MKWPIGSDGPDGGGSRSTGQNDNETAMQVLELEG